MAAFAVAYGVVHHQGALFAPLGELPGVADGGTRWADWLDLATPLVVLGPAAAALVATGDRRRRTWLLFGLGVAAYVEGHGIHLAANSISNEAAAAGGHPTAVTHLWDEPVGHHLWFAGLALVVVALTVALDGRCRLARGPVAVVLAVGVGATWATNALEGGTAPFSLVLAVAALAWAAAARRRDPIARSVPDLLLVASLSAVVPILGYGLLQGGFPQPSEIGWGPFG